MYRMAFIAGILCCAFSAGAWQWRHKIPEAVISSASKQYPGARVKKWSESNDTFVARFSGRFHRQRVYYSANGKWIRTETRIPWTWDLPPAVAHAWEHSSFNSWPVENIRHEEETGRNTYVINIYQDWTPVEGVAGSSIERRRLIYSPEGKLLESLQTEEP